MKRLLEILKKKRAAKNLDSRHNSMIDNAFYNCNPPEHKQATRKVRPIIHEFFRYMVYVVACSTRSASRGLLHRDVLHEGCSTRSYPREGAVADLFLIY